MARPSVTGFPAASEAVTAKGGLRDWRPSQWAALAAVLLFGIAIRLVLLPAQGLRGDIDQFVGWVHHIATNGLGTLYGATDAGPVTFGPVMAYIWATLAAFAPGFLTATDASDEGIRILMKMPASIADVGLALLIGYALRARPMWAVIGAAAIFLHPAVPYVSAWWGQYESVYVVSALAATILAINGRYGWAAAAITVSLMTKPQALPLVLPFVAWFWATGGWRAVTRAMAIGALVTVVLWLPFIPAGGPAGYLANLAEYQGDIFAIASIRAWNLWWLVQEALAGGAFVADDVAVVGPITLRHMSLALTGILELAIASALLRNPSGRAFILALAASVLVAFSFLTTMHERYAYAALVFFALSVTELRMRWLGVAFGVVFTLNLIAAIPTTPEIGALIPIAGPPGVVGSIAMLAITAMLVWMVAEPRPPMPAPA